MTSATPTSKPHQFIVLSVYLSIMAWYIRTKTLFSGPIGYYLSFFIPPFVLLPLHVYWTLVLQTIHCNPRQVTHSQGTNTKGHIRQLRGPRPLDRVPGAVSKPPIWNRGATAPLLETRPIPKIRKHCNLTRFNSARCNVVAEPQRFNPTISCVTRRASATDRCSIGRSLAWLLSPIWTGM